MSRFLQAGVLAGTMLCAAIGATRAETAATYGVAPGMTQAEAMAVLKDVADCRVEKQMLDEGYLPSGTYQLVTRCVLKDGRGSLALRTTSSLSGERIVEIEHGFRSSEPADAAADTVARAYGVAAGSAEHVGGEWLWRLSDHLELTLFVYPRGDARAAVLRDTALQQQDLLARNAHTIAFVTGAPGGRAGRGS